MAYVSQEKKAQLAPGIKAVLKRYGVKGTISVRNHSTLVVTLKSSKMDIIGNWFKQLKSDPSLDRYNYVKEQPTYLDVNHHYIAENFTGEVRNFLTELLQEMRGKDWFDKSDIQTDYFHVAHYVDINVGRWDKPFEVEGPRVSRFA